MKVKTFHALTMQDAMRAIKPMVSACYEAHRQQGTVIVNYLIEGDGRVSAATASSTTLAGTPSAQCVADAVRSARFRAFTGARMSVSYPFILR